MTSGSTNEETRPPKGLRVRLVLSWIVCAGALIFLERIGLGGSFIMTFSIWTLRLGVSKYTGGYDFGFWCGFSLQWVARSLVLPYVLKPGDGWMEIFILAWVMTSVTFYGMVCQDRRLLRMKLPERTNWVGS